MFEVVAREEELASLRAFIDDADGHTAALVLEGEAGIGKSMLCLASRPAEAERALAHAGLGDLFEPVLGEILLL